MMYGKDQIEVAFNEWMRIYTEEPEKFNNSYTEVKTFLEQEAAGEVPTYGQEATAYLVSLIS